MTVSSSQIPTTGSANPNVQWENVWDLFKQLATREVSESVKGSSLGALWLVFNPVLSMSLYVLVFGIFFGGSFGRVEHESSLSYAIGIYIGLSLVNLINETISKATNNLHRHANLIRKVVFPLVILPFVQVYGTAFSLGINMVLWLGMSAFYGTVFHWQIAYLPLILLPMLGIALGLSTLISALSVYFRDIQQLTNVVTQIVFWSSGVFFSSERVMEIPQIWAFLKWNPVLLAIENIREIVLWGMSPNLSQIAYLYAVAAFFLFLGFFVFSRLRSGFSDFL